MDCSEIRRFLHAYIDLEFDEREQIEFELHLAQCPCCREEVNYYRALRRTLRKKVPRKVAPIHLEALIRGTIEHEERVQRGWLSFSMATVGAFMFALGTFLWSSNVSDIMVASNNHAARTTNVSYEPGQNEYSSSEEQRRLSQQFLRDLYQKTKTLEDRDNNVSMEPASKSQGLFQRTGTQGRVPTISLRNCDLPSNHRQPGHLHQSPWCQNARSKAKSRLTNVNLQE